MVRTGNDVSSGDVINPFFPSFTFEVDLQTGTLLEDSTLTHRYLWLVYRQRDNQRIEGLVPEGDLCSIVALFGRSQVVAKSILHSIDAYARLT